MLFLPGRHVYQGGGRKRLPWPKPVWPINGSKQPNSASIGFGEFSRVLALKMSIFGLGFYLERKTRFI